MSATLTIFAVLQRVGSFLKRFKSVTCLQIRAKNMRCELALQVDQCTSVWCLAPEAVPETDSLTPKRYDEHPRPLPGKSATPLRLFRQGSHRHGQVMESRGVRNLEWWWVMEFHFFLILDTQWYSQTLTLFTAHQNLWPKEFFVFTSSQFSRPWNDLKVME